MGLRRTFKRRFGRIVALAAMFFFAPALGAKAAGLTIELNKLEPQKESCRAYVVVTNNGSTVYQALKLDLVLFQPDGVIGRRFALDLGPLKAQKRSVKLTQLPAFTVLRTVDQPDVGFVAQGDAPEALTVATTQPAVYAELPALPATALAEIRQHR
jgi:hypothetical protein